MNMSESGRAREKSEGWNGWRAAILMKDHLRVARCSRRCREACAPAYLTTTKHEADVTEKIRPASNKENDLTSMIYQSNLPLCICIRFRPLPFLGSAILPHAEDLQFTLKHPSISPF